MKFTRPLCLTVGVASLGLMSVALAQTVRHPSSGIHTITGHKLATVKAAVIDTRDFAQQINTFSINVGENPENPAPPIRWNPNVGSGSNVIVGNSTLNKKYQGGIAFPGIGQTGYVPPDPNIACGPNYLVETVNDHVAFFNKSTGAKVLEQSFGTFFAPLNPPSGFLFDPKSMYDKVSGRFFFLADEGAGSDSAIDIACSQTSDPNGKWNLYRFNAEQSVGGNTFWLDYPSLGNSTTGIVITGNMFGNQGGFNGVQFIVVPKAPMLAGTPVTATSLTDTSNASAQMARDWDATQTNVYGLALSSNSSMRVYSVNNPNQSPTVQFVDVSIPNFEGSQQDGMSKDGHYLATLGDRIFNVYERNGHLVTGHSVQQNSGRGNRSNARWEQFSINGWPTSGNLPKLVQSGQIDTGAQDDDFMPAIGEDIYGDLGITFTRCSPTIVDDIMFSGRLPSDPLGNTSTPQVFIGATSDYGSQGGNRWGDFFDSALDPTNENTFWGIGMISNGSGGWQTEFFTYSLSNGGGTLPLTFNPYAVSMYEGSGSSGTLQNLFNEDHQYYSVTSLNKGGKTFAASAVIDYTMPNPATLTAVSIGVDAQFTSRFVTRQIFAYNWLVGSYQLLKATSASIGGEQQIPVANFAQFIDGSGHMRVLVRGEAPNRGSLGGNFTMNIDQAIGEASN